MSVCFRPPKKHEIQIEQYYNWCPLQLFEESLGAGMARRSAPGLEELPEKLKELLLLRENVLPPVPVEDGVLLPKLKASVPNPVGLTF